MLWLPEISLRVCRGTLVAGRLMRAFAVLPAGATDLASFAYQWVHRTAFILAVFKCIALISAFLAVFRPLISSEPTHLQLVAVRSTENNQHT